MSKKNIMCRIFGHKDYMVQRGFACKRCGRYREGAWAKIPPPPKMPRSVEKRIEYKELWDNSKSVTDMFNAFVLESSGLDTETCDVLYVNEKYIFLDRYSPLLIEDMRNAQRRWSLGRLISLVPKCIIPKGTSTDYLFTMSGDFLSYSHYEDRDHVSDLVFVRCEGDYLRGMVTIIVWLIEKGFLDKKYLREDAENNVQ